MNEPTTILTGLARELGKRRPFEHFEEEALLNVLRTSSVLTNRMARVMRAWDLTEPGYNILRILRGSGDTGRCPGEISADMVSAVPDMTRLIDRLEKRALTERRRVDTDRRMVRVFITAAGVEVLDKMYEPVTEETKRLLGGLSRTELRTLSDLLFKLRDGLKGNELGR